MFVGAFLGDCFVGAFSFVEHFKKTKVANDFQGPRASVSRRKNTSPPSFRACIPGLSSRQPVAKIGNVSPRERLFSREKPCFGCGLTQGPCGGLRCFHLRPLRKHLEESNGPLRRASKPFLQPFVAVEDCLQICSSHFGASFSRRCGGEKRACWQPQNDSKVIPKASCGQCVYQSPNLHDS